LRNRAGHTPCWRGSCTAHCPDHPAFSTAEADVFLRFSNSTATEGRCLAIALPCLNRE